MKGSRQGVGGGPAGEDTVQIAVFGRDAGGTGCWYLHLYRVVLRVRDRGDRLHLRGLAKREERSTPKTRSRGSWLARGPIARVSKMAISTVHGPTGWRRENGRLQKRDRRREKTKWHAHETTDQRV